MGNMVACKPQPMTAGNAFTHYQQRFIRSPHLTPSHPHTYTHSLNERVVVSREDGKSWAIAVGNVTLTRESEVELLLDKLV